MFVLKLALVLSRKMIIWSRNYTFVVGLLWNENGDFPFLIVFFTRYGHTYIREKKSGHKKLYFFSYEWREFPHLDRHLEPQRIMK